MRFSRVYTGVVVLLFAFLILFNINNGNHSAIPAPFYIRVPAALAMVVWGMYLIFTRVSSETKTSAKPESLLGAIGVVIWWLFVTLFIAASLDSIL